MVKACLLTRLSEDLRRCRHTVRRTGTGVAVDIEIDEVSDLDRYWLELAGLLKELHDYHASLTGVALVKDWEQRQKANLEAMSQSGEAIVLIARRSGAAVGLVTAHIAENPAVVQERVGFLDNIYVKAEVREKGICSRLLERVEGWFRDRDVTVAQVGVASASSHAKEIWEAKGYRPYLERLRKPLA
jgi:GNAT superfamily N-acetyltransferase